MLLLNLSHSECSCFSLKLFSMSFCALAVLVVCAVCGVVLVAICWEDLLKLPWDVRRCNILFNWPPPADIFLANFILKSELSNVTLQKDIMSISFIAFLIFVHQLPCSLI